MDRDRVSQESRRVTRWLVCGVVLTTAAHLLLHFSRSRSTADTSLVAHSGESNNTPRRISALETFISDLPNEVGNWGQHRVKLDIETVAEALSVDLSAQGFTSSATLSILGITDSQLAAVNRVIGSNTQRVQQLEKDALEIIDDEDGQYMRLPVNDLSGIISDTMDSLASVLPKDIAPVVQLAVLKSLWFEEVDEPTEFAVVIEENGTIYFERRQDGIRKWRRRLDNDVEAGAFERLGDIERFLHLIEFEAVLEMVRTEEAKRSTDRDETD